MSVTWAYTVSYNEADLISYWVRHHRTFCDRVIVYADPECTDDTAVLAEREGAEVRSTFSSPLDDDAFVAFANVQWQEATGQADWVMWLDSDEFLYHPHARKRLDEFTQSGVNLPRTAQYCMVSPAVPTHAGQIYDRPEFRRGHPTEAKQAPIFNPNELYVQWGVGKHQATTLRGQVRRDYDRDTPFRLLHYRWLGEEYLRARDAKNYARLPAAAVSAGMGYHVYPGFVGPYDAAWPADVRPADAQVVF